jgi:hypothetical protein
LGVIQNELEFKRDIEMSDGVKVIVKNINTKRLESGFYCVGSVNQ